MQIARNSELNALHSTAEHQRSTVFIDCADRTRQDVLAYWLARSGFRVLEGSMPDPSTPGNIEAGDSVLLTDRFGPGLDGEATIFQLKERRPALRVVIVGRGDGVETAQLSLARAAGADATLPSPLEREHVLELLERWT